MAMDDKFLEVALDAIKKGEDIILKHFSRSTSYSLKTDETPVTIADQAAERIIKETIQKAFPDHGFLGEEEGEESSSSEYIWIIDPIDGTKNYMRQLPFFSTELALMKKRQIILGVSNSPVLKDLMWAQKGKGSFSNGKRVKVSNRSLEESFACFGSLNGFVKSKKFPKLEKLIQKVLASRGFGDCWSYHLLAQGNLDIMTEAIVKIWDIAAVTIIVEEAGGKVTQIDGHPISLTSTDIVATNGKIHHQILELINS